MLVVVDACKNAVELVPNTSRIKDSRGVVRARTGNFTGAIEDFQDYLSNAEQNQISNRKQNQRKQWIKKLENNENPFTKEVLEELG